jgi:hypothetical protein
MSILNEGIVLIVFLEADLFAENQDIHSQLHAVFICRIVSNRPQYLRRPDNFRTRPDRGYDRVCGKVRA